MNRMTVAQKIAINKYELDEGHPHIHVQQEACRAACPDLACLYICPANVYSEQGGQIIADWAACLECTTCTVACPTEGLDWKYPRGGFGIIYREG